MIRLFDRHLTPIGYLPETFSVRKRECFHAVGTAAVTAKRDPLGLRPGQFLVFEDDRAYRICAVEQNENGFRAEAKDALALFGFTANRSATQLYGPAGPMLCELARRAADSFPKPLGTVSTSVDTTPHVYYPPYVSIRTTLLEVAADWDLGIRVDFDEATGHFVFRVYDTTVAARFLSETDGRATLIRERIDDRDEYNTAVVYGYYHNDGSRAMQVVSRPDPLPRKEITVDAKGIPSSIEGGYDVYLTREGERALTRHATTREETYRIVDPTFIPRLGERFRRRRADESETYGIVTAIETSFTSGRVTRDMTLSF